MGNCIADELTSACTECAISDFFQDMGITFTSSLNLIGSRNVHAILLDMPGRVWIRRWSSHLLSLNPMANPRTITILTDYCSFDRNAGRLGIPINYLCCSRDSVIKGRRFLTSQFLTSLTEHSNVMAKFISDSNWFFLGKV